MNEPFKMTIHAKEETVELFGPVLYFKRVGLTELIYGQSLRQQFESAESAADEPVIVGK